MSAAPSIRTATEEQMDAIADLLLRAYEEFAPDPAEQRRLGWDDYRREMADVKSRWDFSQHLVVEDHEGRLLAAATYIPDGSVPQMHEDRWPEGYAAMRLLAVDPGARGRGLGRLLTQECLRRARAAGRAWFGLHTTELMKIARDMYERMGFTRFPERDIPITEDFVVVAYRLPLT